MEPKFLRAEEVAQELGISKSYAYKIVQKLNEELKNKGFLTILGRVNKQYFMNATSSAANVSPMQMEAISASNTSTSALMSKAVTSPITASRMMGMPQRGYAHNIPLRVYCVKKKAARRLLFSFETSHRVRGSGAAF